ncbi:MAG: RDD family protein, partial [Gammaproteobacteria bacterium]
LPRRLIVMVYDGLVVTGLLLIAAAVALPVTGDRVQAGRDVFYTLYLLAVWFAYLGWCWSRAGQTIGMKAWRVRLAPQPGTPFTPWRALVRFAVSLCSAAALGAGFLHALLRRDRATWHDLASGTRLLVEPRPPKRRR